MSDEKILPGEYSDKKPSDDMIIGGDAKKNNEFGVATGGGTLTDRISLSTKSGGLKDLPVGFDDIEGDWKVIKSTNPFEVLFLDYKQYKFITGEIVKKNNDVLYKFWKSKCDSIGSNRDRFEKKYDIKPFESCLNILGNAFQKISSQEGIESYYQDLNNKRLEKGREGLRDSIEQMIVDGEADRNEMGLCFERGAKYDLSREEIAEIIKKTLDDEGFIPYGTPAGNSLSEQLVSVDSWMTPKKKEEADKIKREKELLKIQILPGKYAATIEEIGTILFDDPDEAKAIIKEDLLKQAIAQKDIVLARTIGKMSPNAKNIDSVYLEIIYKLNPALPYKLSGGRLSNTPSALCMDIFENEQTLKIGKEHLKKGFIEIWLKENNVVAHSQLIKIIKSAENFELAFLEFIYTFCPELPYRFAGQKSVKTPEELGLEINKSKESWDAGKAELFNSAILTWLKTTGKSEITREWDKIKNKYVGNEDVGLEEFLHLLDAKLEFAHLEVDKTKISFPSIQSGHIVTKEILFTNELRGFIEGNLTFTKMLDGVSLSSKNIFLNTAAKINSSKVTLTIDTSKLLKGVVYETIIQLNTSTNQKIEIPVSFEVVFPTNAFIIEITKYAAVVAAFFVLIRLIIASDYPNWLNKSLDFFLDWSNAIRYAGDFALFGWTFLLFVVGISFGLYFLLRYLFSIKNTDAKQPPLKTQHSNKLK